MKKHLFLTIIFFLSINSYAAKVVGAEIYFETKGDGKVDVYVKRYTLLSNKDTSPIKINLLVGNTFFTQKSILLYSSILSSYNKKYTLTNADSFSARVSKEEVFKTTFNFNLKTLDTLLKAHCMALFFYTDSSRNMGQTVFDSTKRFYIDASLNMCLYKTLKTKPEFTVAPLFSLCCNNQITICPGYKNLHNIKDSFSFDIISVKDSINKNISYNSPNTSQLPLNPYCHLGSGNVSCRPLPGTRPPRGFYIDKKFNYISFTPVSCKQSSAIVFQTTIYTLDSLSRWLKVGYISREQSARTETCRDNNSPVTSYNNNYSVCAGDKICFTLKSSDYQSLPSQKVPDTTTLSWDKTIANATFTIRDSTEREKKGDFCWNTHDSDGRYAPYIFTVQAKDNAYPIEGIGTMAIKIMVRPRPIKNKTYTFLDCNRLAFSFKREHYSLLRWDFYDTLNNYYGGSQKFSDTIQFYGLKSNAMVVKVGYSYLNCPAFDTIFNTNQITDNQTNKDTIVCVTNNSFNLNVLNKDSIKNTTWLVNNIIVQDKIIDFTIIKSFPAVFQIKMRFVNNNNCGAERTLRLVVENVKVKVLKPFKICPQENVNVFELGFFKRMDAYWSSNIEASIDTLGYLNKSIYKDSLRLVYYYDSSVCTHSEIKIMLIDSLPRTSFFQDTTFCSTAESINLETINKQNISNTAWFLNDSLLSTKILSFKPLNNFPIALPLIMKYTNDSGCLASKKIVISINAPSTKTSTPIYICKTEHPNMFKNGFTKRTNGVWQSFGNVAIDSNGSLKGIFKTESLTVSYYFDSAFCTHSENLNILIDTGVAANFYADTVSNNQPFIVYFKDNSTGKVKQFLWNFGNIKTLLDSSTQRNPSYFYDLVGQYSVTLIVKGRSCSDTLTKKNYITIIKNTSIHKPLTQEVFTLFPNPADKTIAINTATETEIQIINTLGMALLKASLPSGESIIDIGGLPSGVYFVKSNMGVKKFLVAH